MPIWFVSIKYRDKVYDFCINDQTGKLSGIRFLNKLKIFLLIFVFIVSMILIFGLLMAFMSYDYFLSNIIFFSWIFGMIFGCVKIYGICSSYNHIVRGKKSVDYIKEGTYKQLFTSDQF